MGSCHLHQVVTDMIKSPSSQDVLCNFMAGIQSSGMDDAS